MASSLRRHPPLGDEAIRAMRLRHETGGFSIAGWNQAGSIPL